MATTVSKVVLSGGADGKGVLIAATATLGTTIHTAHATAEDEIWLYVYNNDTADHTISIEFGEATTTMILKKTISSQSTETGAVLVIPGWILTGSLVLTAFADAANKLVVNGYVNRITQ